MRYPTDVPIHRPSVVAMKVTTAVEEPRVFKPYVYRGTGEDQYPTEEIKQPKRKPLSAAKRRRANEKRRKTVLNKEKAYEIRNRMRLEAKAYWAAKEAEQRAARQAEREAALALRPAPGWKPTAGEDIDNWLNEMED